LITAKIINQCIKETVGVEKLAVILNIERLLVISSDEHSIDSQAYWDTQDLLIHCRTILSLLQEKFSTQKNQF